jgi:transcription elongation factor
MDKKVEELIKQRVKLELAGSGESLDKAILKVVHINSSKGMLQSGGTAVDLSKVVRGEVRDRIRTIWHIIHRMVTSSNVAIDEELSITLRGLLESLTKDYTNSLPAFYVEHTTKYVQGTFVQELSETIENDIENELQIQLSELELFAINYQTRIQAETGSVVNVYGTAGSIQTGSNSVANVNFQINSALELKQFLEQISHDLELLKGYPDTEKQELREVISDGSIAI